MSAHRPSLRSVLSVVIASTLIVGGLGWSAEAASAADDSAYGGVSGNSGGPGAATAPDSGRIRIEVQAGGARNASGGLEGLAGVRYSAYQGTDVNRLDGAEQAWCTTDASGVCWMDLPTRGNQQGYVVAVSAVPQGWSSVEKLRVGVAPATEQSYRFTTGSANRSRVYHLPSAGEDNRQSSETWMFTRDNPVLTTTCGIDVAVVADLSASVQRVNGQEPLRQAARAFVDALTGTPSRIAFTTFGWDSPAPNPERGSTFTVDGVAYGKNDDLGWQSVADPEAVSTRIAQAKAQNLQVNDLPRDQATNWDRGLVQAQTVAPDADLVIVLTDGNPSVYGKPSQGAGTHTRFIDIEHAMASANSIKNAGTRLVVVGVGDGVSGSPVNLEAISDQRGDSFFQVSSYDALAGALTELATENCEGVVNIIKQEVKLDGTSAVGVGWTFTATAPGNTVRRDGTTDEFSTTASGVTNDAGGVGFRLNFAGTTADERRLTIVEAQKDGYSLLPQDGSHARCWIGSDRTKTVSVTNAPDGFVVDPLEGETVNCQLRNEEKKPSADLALNLTATPRFQRDYNWGIQKTVAQPSAVVTPGQSSEFDYTVEVTPQAPIDTDFAVTGALSVTNPNDIAAAQVTALVSLPEAECRIEGDNTVSVPAHGSASFDYSCVLDGGTAASVSDVSATVTWAELPGSKGTASTTTPADFSTVTPTVTDETVVVTDSAAEFAAQYSEEQRTLHAAQLLGSDNPVASFTYTRSLGADLDPGTCQEYPNTASIAAGSQGQVDSAANVSVCAGADLTVAKSVVQSLTRSYDWSIRKEVDRTTATVDENGRASFEYTVTATPGESTDSAWLLKGQITVTNPNAWDVGIDSIVDLPDISEEDVCAITVNGQPVQNAVIGAGKTTVFDYDCAFKEKPRYQGLNTAKITWDAEAAHTPNSSAKGTATIAEDAWQTTPVNRDITVTDDKTVAGSAITLGTATWNAEGTPTVFTYALDVPGPESAGTCAEHTNTAWIAGIPAASVSQTVTVCDYADLTVELGLTSAAKRTYSYDLQKDAAASTVQVDPNTGVATAEYVVTVTDGDYADSDITLGGTVTVRNPNTAPVTITDPVLAVDGAENCTLAGGDFTVPAKGAATFDIECENITALLTPQHGATATVRWEGLPGTSGEASADAQIAAPALQHENNTVRIVDDKTNPDAQPVSLGAHTWSGVGATEEFRYALELRAEPGTCVSYDNTASVAENGESAQATVTACAPNGEIAKRLVSATQSEDLSWQVEYELTVTGSTAADFRYDLRDIFDFGEGIAVIPGTARVAGPEGVVLAEGWDGAAQPLIAGDVTLPKDVPSHVYTVSVSATVAQDAAGWQCHDGSAGGFRNTAQVFFTGVPTPLDEAEACGSPDLPTVDIEKKVVSTAQQADGRWEIGYDIIVTNPSELIAVYALTDELRFGADIVVDEAWWTGPSEGTFEGTNAQLASSAVLAVGASHTYRVTVRADVPPAAYQDASQCLPGSVAGGFLNTATVTAGGKAAQAEDCAEPALPTVTKTGLSAVQDPDVPSRWTVSYEIAVQSGGVDTVYDLADVPGFASGIELVEGSAQRTDSAEVPVLPVHAGEDFVTDVVLGAAETHRYRVDWHVVVTAAAGATVCADGAGNGFFNTAVLGVGDIDIDAFACLPVAEQVYPTVQKTVTDVTPHDDGGWQIDYAIDVTLPADDKGLSASYDLSDTLAYGAGVSVRKAEWEGPDGRVGAFADGTAVLAKAEVLGSGETHRYTVSVVAEVGAQAVAGGTALCTPAGNGGFLNTAQLTSGAQVTDVSACADAHYDDVGIEKTNDTGAATVEAGQVFDYVLTVTNYGTRAAENVVVTDAIPAALVVQQVTVPAGWTNANGTKPVDETGTVRVEVPTLAVGAAAEVRVTVRVADEDALPSERSIHNEAVVDAQRDENPDNDRDDDTVLVPKPKAPTDPVPPAATELDIQKDASVTQTSGGDTFDYTIAVANVHEYGAAGGVVVTDEIPAELSVVGIDLDRKVLPSWESCAVSGATSAGYGGTLHCELSAPLAAGEKAPLITVHVAVAEKTEATSITNIAVVDYHAFDDPTVTGHDEDDARVWLGLAVTGAMISVGALSLALLLTLGGMILVALGRRRKEVA